MNMPPIPQRSNVRLPAWSISGIVTNVMIRIMAPVPIVQNLALSDDKPELVNMLVE